ncbi:hypothetical protein HAP94_17010 [Acidithiobacillus ferrivorans]|nr:hypothetical protein [Acidithiobacillus ferrivorans]
MKRAPDLTAIESPRQGNHITIGVVRNAHDPRITPRALSWSEFCQYLSIAEVRETKDGTGFVLAQFNTMHRAGKNVASVSALGFDVDGKDQAPLPPLAAHIELSRLGWAHVVYSTWSHSAESPRYRIIIALDAPLHPDVLRDAQSYVVDQLPEAIAQAIDRACLGDRARLYYAPATPPDRASGYEFYTGGSAPLSARTLTLIAAAMQHQREAKKAKAKAMTARIAARGGVSVIAQFNEQHTIEEVLENGGYTRNGKRWVSPHSHSGTPGIVEIEGRIFCHHADDPMHNGHALDAFDAYAAIYHNGSLSAAAAAVRGVQHG